MYGHELNETRTPAETSRGLFVDLSKEFVGKAGVEADLNKPKQLLVGLKFPSKRAARAHDKVFTGDDEIGAITSGSVAPSLGLAVAMAFVTAEYAVCGANLDVEIRGKRIVAEVVALPFYEHGTARG